VPPVVVFDTNILFSAIGWRGRPYACLERARNGLVDGITCQELLDELTDKLRTRLAFTDEQLAETLADLLGFLSLVAIPNTLHGVSVDPDDDKVLECAVVGRATHIVSGDRRHVLPLGSYQGIVIVSAADFLAHVSPAP
jgi:putative PIN family toxin of toxin-antitoxin system